MRTLQTAEVESVAGGLGYWVEDTLYVDCYYDYYTGIEYCDTVFVPGYYYEYSVVEEALIWTGITVAGLGLIGGITAAVLLA